MTEHELALHYLRRCKEVFNEQEHLKVVEYKLNVVAKDFGKLVNKYNKGEKKVNKFQEALDELEGNAVQQQQSHVGIYKNGENANINGINKMIGYSQTLQELVDRATPMKPHITFRYTTPIFEEMHEVKEERCPNCYWLLYRDWSCVNNDCRQAIDWEKGETK